MAYDAVMRLARPKCLERLGVARVDHPCSRHDIGRLTTPATRTRRAVREFLDGGYRAMRELRADTGSGARQSD
jgi:hypothetical protein